MLPFWSPRHRRSFWLATLLCLALSSLVLPVVQAADTDIIITEIMYNPDSSESSPNDVEWVELYNSGNTVIDLSGWYLDDEDSSNWGPIPSSISIQAGEAIVLAPDDLSAGDFSAAWGAGFQVILVDWGSLANGPSATSEILQLYTDGDTLIDEVNFDDSGNWPSDSPDGPSIYLTDLTADNNVGTNWARSVVGTDGAYNNTVTTPFNGSDTGSPGVVPTVVTDPPPSVTLTVPADGATISDLTQKPELTFNENITTPGAPTNWASVDCTSYSNPVTFDNFVPGNQAFFILAVPDYQFGDTCTVTVFASAVTDSTGQFLDGNGDGTGGDDFSFTFTVQNIEQFIHDVQGNPSTYSDDDFTGILDESPFHEQTVMVEGVVVGDFQETGEFAGFFMQEETSDQDADPTSSEGIFVLCDAACTDVSVGNIVSVTGNVDEYFNQTQIDNDSANLSVTILDAGNNLDLVTPALIDFPFAAPATDLDASPLEAFEGMLAEVNDTMRVAEFFQYGRYSQIRVWTDGTLADRQLQYTQTNAPDVSGFAAAERSFLANSFFIDDGHSGQNLDPKPYPVGFLDGSSVNAANGFRGGDAVTNLFGVFNYARSRGTNADADWRLHVYDFSEGQAILQEDEITRQLPTFTATNPRPSSVPSVGNASVTVASFNVLNYFTTLGSRGADTSGELLRQRQKIAEAICEIDADIVGLIEIENNGVTALNDLLTGTDGVNSNCGPYTALNTGMIGTDAIAVAFIYKDSAVSTIGNFAVLDSSVDPRFADTRNRPALAQTFQDDSGGGVLTVVVNHFKSKGSSCAGDTPPDPNLNDGAGNCNLTRTNAAEALVDWLATDPTHSGDEDFMIIGDLNAYREEDPINAVLEGADDSFGTADDYTNLVFNQYGYVFDGRWGTLDYALVNFSLADEVTGAVSWHINADEPNALDYDTDFNPAYWFEQNAFRSSDHDPVVVGLDLLGYGDCNNDFTVDAGDIAALLLELNDGDGSDAADVQGGSFLGNRAGCDSNGDGLVNTVDLACTRDLIFSDTVTCSVP